MTKLRQLWHSISHLMDDVHHEPYTPLAPRRPDGTRTTLFPLNSSGSR